MRPKLNLKTTPDEFINFYWLKEELISFCKQNNLPRSDSKDELIQRIYEYLKSGRILVCSKDNIASSSTKNTPLELEAKIPEGYRNDERHRIFFKSVIGDHFKFNVSFMDWMNNNSGKTYKEAVGVWNDIAYKKKQGKKTDISSQFQYNQYTRDFFEQNPHAKREDVIKCWNYKKSLPGHNKYEKTDLIALLKLVKKRK